MDFGDKIKELRSLRKYSLDELSQRSGVSKSMISKIERKEKMPTLQVAAKISEALGTTLSSLLADASAAEIVVTRREDRRVFLDELTGFRRELLSPQRPDPALEFIENRILPRRHFPRTGRAWRSTSPFFPARSRHGSGSGKSDSRQAIPCSSRRTSRINSATMGRLHAVTINPSFEGE